MVDSGIGMCCLPTSNVPPKRRQLLTGRLQYAIRVLTLGRHGLDTGLELALKNRSNPIIPRSLFTTQITDKSAISPYGYEIL